MPEGEVETDVKCAFDLPFQVWIGITHDAEGYGWCIFYRHDTVGLYELHGVVGVDASLVSRQSIADTQLGIVDEFLLLHPRLLADDPGTTD